MIKAELDRRNIPYDYFFSEYPRHPEKIARDIAQSEKEKIAAIIAVGGDGTIHEVMNGLQGYSYIKIGFIPAGSGNDFARGFLIPKDPNRALDFILIEDSTIGVDAGAYQLNENEKERLFINNLGVGFDAEVSLAANQSRMKKWFNKLGIGRFTYVVALIKTAITYKPNDVMLTIDHEIKHIPKVWFITISNQTYYGGGMKISPAAKPNDGLLNITVVHQLSKIKLLFIFISVFFGKHTKFKEVKMLSGKNITINSHEPMKVHTDGEMAGESPVKIKVKPSYFQVFSKL